MKPLKLKRTAVAYRLRTDVVRIISKLARQERISRTRFVELCVERQARAVARNPFPSLGEVA